MELMEALCTRRAVREFTAEPLIDSTIEEVIEAAIMAPSAVNLQPCDMREQTYLPVRRWWLTLPIILSRFFKAQPHLLSSAPFMV